MVSGTKSPSDQRFSVCVQLCFGRLECCSEKKCHLISLLPPLPTSLSHPDAHSAFSDSELWWASETGRWLPWVTGMMEFWRVCVGSRNAALKPCTHNLLKNIPWAENVFFLFSPPLFLCQAGTMVPFRGAAGRGCWQGGWK